MTTRIALGAVDKSALVTNFTFCGCSVCQQASDGILGKTYVATADDLSVFASTAHDIGVLTPPVISDAEVPLLTNITHPGGSGLQAFNVTLMAGQTYTFSLRGTGADPIPDSLLFMVADTDGDGVLETNGQDAIYVDDDGGDGLNSMFTYTATYTGAHRFFVGAAGSLEGGQWSFTAIPDDGADESDSFAGAIDLDLGDVYYGFIDFVPNPGQRPYGRDFGEVDTFTITLEAGKAYTIEASGGADYLSDFRALPPGEVDTYMVVYGPDGSVMQNDDASFASGDIGSGLSFVADATGTYTIDVFAYAPQTGGYSIVAKEIDLTDRDPLEALYWDSAANIDPGDDNIVKVYFAAPDENFGELADNGEDPLPSFGWNAWEQQQLMVALQEYTKVLGFEYQVTDNVDEADFRLITTTSEQFGAYFYPQDPVYGDAQGIGAFNVDSGGWNFDQQQSLTQGGFAFAVMLHEFGHAHGLAHPHDTGGGSEVLAGVFGPFDSYGFYDLNQGVYTVMSYNDAWPLHPDGPSPFTAEGIDNGWSGTLGAFDIAALQNRYGVTMEDAPNATGDDVYQLNDVADVGTYYECIYDTDGTDEIRYDGERGARIDLTAATLDYSATGAGALSFVDEIKGGYTIANGVVIENARSGNGDDVLIGNSAANVLRGLNGRDTLLGRDGDDILLGNRGNDLLDGGAGNDIYQAGQGRDVFAFDDGSGDDLITDFKRGDDKIDLSAIDADVDAAGEQGFAWIGSATFSGAAGELRAYSEGGLNYVAGDVDGDSLADFTIQTNVLVGQSDILFGDNAVAGSLSAIGAADFIRPSHLSAINMDLVVV